MADLLLKTAHKRLEFLARDMKDYPPGKWFEAPAFKMHESFILYARIYPNIYSDYEEWSGQVSLHIFMEKVPTHLKKV